MEKEMDKIGSMAFPASSKDPTYEKPYIDEDEWRDEPVRYRYVHGGFEGTDCKFSFYFPPPETYEGRFYHHLMAVSGMEKAAFEPAMAGFMIPDSIPFTINAGAYFVESNQGRITMFPGEDPTVQYRASAAAARYSRVVAADMYGPHRPYGYVFGGSGGAFKTLACFESDLSVWDGALPFVMGSPMAGPYAFTAQAHVMRILWDKFPAIIDAIEPGGSGDMYEGLNLEEREALAEITRMGFPPRTWFNYKRIALGYTGVFTSLIDNIVRLDPGYFEDFWKVPGYLGANPTESLKKARIQHKTKITKIVRASEAVQMGLGVSMAARLAERGIDMPAAIQIEIVPEGNLQGAGLNLLSGEAKGHVFYISGAVGDLLMVGFGEAHFRALAAIKAGDELMIDNSVYLAAQTYHRHQIPPDGYHGWDQYKAAGKPVYPQREYVQAIGSAGMAGGATPRGRFAGKMIMVEALMDEAAFPWHADWYRSRVMEALGPTFEDSFRLYFVDHALHTAPWAVPDDPRPVATTRAIPYMTVLHQALRDLAGWVEKGQVPPPSTIYKMDGAQVVVPPTAVDRKGIQPVVTLTANGSVRADVKVGEKVEFVGVIEVPPGTGTVVGAEWDFEGAGDYPVAENFDFTNNSFSRMTVKATYAFSKPGTYFPVLRGSSHRHSDFGTPFARIPNIGRVRVVVT
jgi:hypothetical protein